MGLIIQGSFLVLVSLASVSVCCGLLAILARVPLLVARQRATLSGVGQ